MRQQHYVFVGLVDRNIESVFIDTVEYVPQENMGAVRAKLKQPDLEIIYSDRAPFEGTGYGQNFPHGLMPEILSVEFDEEGPLNRSFSQYRSKSTFFLYEVNFETAIRELYRRTNEKTYFAGWLDSLKSALEAEVKEWDRQRESR